MLKIDKTSLFWLLCTHGYLFISALLSDNYVNTTWNLLLLLSAGGAGDLLFCHH